ncbi:tumor protein p53-inducible protein 11-like [Gordionus sp. m RMFG-2023]|uniref:tumor protein p53-inducible protein 11-like n=1 Tax=Gordionus sp. m RMFG-2023 TaxID=3053472 RepID=UPI0031FCC064
MHPLEKKQSSVDLISRLKTRKVLGVGESDSGDVYRSKISQILGHSEQLTAPFVKTYWAWHYLSAFFYSIHGLLAIFYPWCIFDTTFQSITQISNNPLATRFYGSSLITLASLFWICLMWGLEKKTIKLCMLLSSILQIIQISTLVFTYLFTSYTKDYFVINIPSFSLFLRMFVILLNFHFYYAINSGKIKRTSGMNESSSTDPKSMFMNSSNVMLSLKLNVYLISDEVAILSFWIIL